MEFSDIFDEFVRWDPNEDPTPPATETDDENDKESPAGADIIANCEIPPAATVHDSEVALNTQAARKYDLSEESPAQWSQPIAGILSSSRLNDLPSPFGISHSAAPTLESGLDASLAITSKQVPRNVRGHNFLNTALDPSDTADEVDSSLRDPPAVGIWPGAGEQVCFNCGTDMNSRVPVTPLITYTNELPVLRGDELDLLPSSMAPPALNFVVPRVLAPPANHIPNSVAPLINQNPTLQPIDKFYNTWEGGHIQEIATDPTVSCAYISYSSSGSAMAPSKFTSHEDTFQVANYNILAAPFIPQSQTDLQENASVTPIFPAMQDTGVTGPSLPVFPPEIFDDLDFPQFDPFLDLPETSSSDVAILIPYDLTMTKTAALPRHTRVAQTLTAPFYPPSQTFPVETSSDIGLPPGAFSYDMSSTLPPLDHPIPNPVSEQQMTENTDMIWDAGATEMPNFGLNFPHGGFNNVVALDDSQITRLSNHPVSQAQYAQSSHSEYRETKVRKYFLRYCA
jgi:hypothetical protein